MVLIELLIVLAAIILIGLFVFAWASATVAFYRQGAKDAGDIEKLAREVYTERSAEKCQRLNQLIDAWNAKYSAKFERTIPRVDCSTFR